MALLVMRLYVIHLWTCLCLLAVSRWYGDCNLEIMNVASARAGRPRATLPGDARFLSRALQTTAALQTASSHSSMLARHRPVHSMCLDAFMNSGDGPRAIATMRRDVVESVNVSHAMHRQQPCAQLTGLCLPSRLVFVYDDVPGVPPRGRIADLVEHCLDTLVRRTTPPVMPQRFVV